jgi:thymidine kinase
MAWADDIIEISSYDSNAKKAMMNIRVNNTGKRVWHGRQVQIGLNYETVHRSEFNLKKALFTGLV